MREENLGRFSTLRQIIARLRGPGGCPWDREQTSASLKPYLLEECYEVIEALEQGDSRKLCEELGDLLMQIVLQAQLAAESGAFDIRDVLRQINAKLLQRHPHVFGGLQVKDAQEVAANWETLKEREREEGTSPLEGLPKGMPALAYAQAMQRRAARAGFHWEGSENTLNRLAAEVRKLRKASDGRERGTMLGNILFTLAELAQQLDVELEEALRLANERFRRCFQYMEEQCRRRGLTLGSLSAPEQRKLWQEAMESLASGRGERI